MKTPQIMTAKKIRVLVFGSSFGQFYLEAIRKLPFDFVLVGLFAKGSERSRKCAEIYNVPLLQNLHEINPQDIDLACMVLRSGVMGGKGSEFACYCMEKGIHVLLEHPIHHSDLANCLRTAKVNAVHFGIGNLYQNLPAFQRFAAVAKKIFLTKQDIYLDIALATQVSYPLVQLMTAILPNARPLHIQHVVKDALPFQLLSGTWAGYPFIMRAHNEVNPIDPDNHRHLLHSIALVCSSGTLALTDNHGPVVWKPQLHIPHQELLKDIATVEQLYERSTLILGPETAPSYLEILQQQWPNAIAQDLLAMKRRILHKKTDASQSAQQALLTARLWHTLMEAMGPPTLKPDAVYEPQDSAALVNWAQAML